MKNIVQTTILLVLILVFGCADDASSTASNAGLHDAGITDINSTPDAQMIAEPDQALVDAQIMMTLAPNWTMPTALDGPEFEGVVIQPALALSDANTLHLAYTVLNPEVLGIYVQTYDLSTQAPLNTVNLLAEPSGLHNEPDICALSGGGAVTVWSVDTQGQGDTNLQVQFRIIDAMGLPVGDGPTIVTTEVEGNHWLGSVGCNDDNGFVIVGSRGDPDDSFGVFAQRYDHLGVAVGQATTVNAESAGGQVYPVITSISGESGHRYAVAYEDRPVASGEPTRVSIRFLDAELVPSTGTFYVSAAGIDATQPSISTIGTPQQVVVTASLDTERVGVFRINPQDESSRYTQGSEGRLNYNTDVVGVGASPVYTFLKGSGRDVQFTLGQYDYEAQTLVETVVYEGWLPPYQTAMARFEDRAAIAVTERLDADRFKLNVFVFGP